MLRKSVFNIIVVGFGNIFNAGLGFLFIIAIARLLPVDEFGKYALITSLLIFLSKFLDFGTNSVFVSSSIAKDEEAIDTFISLKILLLLIVLPVSLVVLMFLDLLTPKTALIFSVGLVGYMINYALFAFFQKDENFTQAVMLNTLPALIKGVWAILILMGLTELSFDGAFAVFSLSILASTFFYVKLPKQYRSFTWNHHEALRLLKTSSPAGFSLVTNDGWQAITNTIIKLSKTFTDIGIFSIADKISNIFSLISISIFTVLLPKNAQRKRDRLAYDFKETIFLSGGIILLSFAAIVIAKFFVVEFLGEKFSSSLALLDILIFASALTAIHSFMENYFFVEEKTKSLFVITFFKLITYLVFSAALIPTMSIIGLAYAYLISSAVALMLTVGSIVSHLRMANVQAPILSDYQPK